MAWRFLLCALLVACAALAATADSEAKSGAKSAAKNGAPPACRSADDRAGGKADAAGDDDADDEDDDDGDAGGVRFQVAGTCAKVTGGVSYTYQQASQTASGLPLFVNSNGTVTSGSFSNTVSANIGLELTRATPVGELKTTVSADWSKATGDGTPNGSGKMSGWSAGLSNTLGVLTVGYTGTLMSFWEGDSLTTANAPGRSASMIVYEYRLDDHNTIAAGLESNLPTTPQTYVGIQSFNLSDPVYTLRWRHERDDFTVHLSGVLRRADFSQSPLLPFLPNTATVRTGWGVSAGLKLPVRALGEDDEFNTQWTYTSDAASYLGISTDLTMYQHTVRSLGPTTGWSAVGGYHHVWSDEFESNAFASFVSLDANLLLASPRARSLRTGINLFWKPVDHLKFGIEFGTVDLRLEPNGVRGIFDGAGGRAYIGVFSVSAEL